MLINGHPIHTTDAMLARLKLCNKEEIYEIAIKCYDKLSDHNEVAEDGLCRLYEFVEGERLWEGREGRREFQIRWEKAAKLQHNKEKDRIAIEKVFKRAVEKWGTDNANRFFQMVNTRSLAEQASKLINTDLTYDDVRLAVNNQVVERLMRRNRGRRRNRHMLQKDLSDAHTAKNLRPLDQEVMRELGLQIDQDGFVCPEGQGEDLNMPATHIHTVNGAGSHGSDIEDEEIKTDEDITDEPVQELITTETDIAPPNPVTETYPDCGCLLPVTTINEITRMKKGASRRDGLRILRKIGHRLRKNGGITAETICTNHARNIVDLLNMRSASKTPSCLLNRIRQAYSNIGHWEQFIQQNEKWFTFRPARGSAGDLGVYQHKPLHCQPLVANFTDISLWFSVETLLRRIYGFLPDIDPWNDMREHGTTVLRGMYSWLGNNFDGNHPHGLWPYIHTEFRMYEYHQNRSIKRLGWQRNMWFSLIQQLVRQDPAYYMAYVFFRPTHDWRLISYPYYAKNTIIGEKTAFRHIDINVQDYLDTGRGGSVLQGSISLTKEDSENCTELLRGMHKQERIKAWWDDIKQRGPLTDGFVQGVENWMWTPSDAKRYGTDWEDEICDIGDARLSLPTIPHGSKGPATAVRRTVLPWFVAVQDDHETLDCAEANTWEELSKAHRDLINASQTPSGFRSTQYAHVPFAFPAAVRFRGASPISECLIGQLRWDRPDVRLELDRLFGKDEKIAHDIIRQWRKNATIEYVNCFQRMRYLERTEFGKESYFHRVDKEMLPTDNEEYLYPKLN